MNEKKLICTILKNGSKRWHKGNLWPHREDGPAIEFPDGTKTWCINGLLHREDGPACEYTNGNKDYYLHGKLVEEKDLPMNKNKELLTKAKDEWPICKIDSRGNKKWENKDGFYHREDGPAIDDIDGYKAWFINGKLHREDGPAQEYPNGDKVYWLNARRVEEKDLPINKEKEESKCKVLKDGTKKWYKNRKLHRLDGPAIEFTDGTKKWYINGRIHREDGPAFENSNGSKEYWVNGKLHREDGPAIEYTSGVKYFYLNDRKVEEKDLPINKNKELLTKEEWPKCAIDEYGGKFWQNKEGELHIEDGPAIERKDGAKEWWINGEIHREDGPALEWADGSKAWCKNNNYHRTDGPAREFANGDKFWYINGKLHRENGPAREFADGRKDYWLNNRCLSSNEINPLNHLKDDISIASYRILCKQIIKITKQIIITTLNLSNKSQLKAVSEFLNSEIGTSFVTYIAGISLSKIQSNKINKISRELRVEGLAVAGNELVNVIIHNLSDIKRGFSKVPQCKNLENKSKFVADFPSDFEHVEDFSVSSLTL